MRANPPVSLISTVGAWAHTAAVEIANAPSTFENIVFSRDGGAFYSDLLRLGWVTWRDWNCAIFVCLAAVLFLTPRRQTQGRLRRQTAMTILIFLLLAGSAFAGLKTDIEFAKAGDVSLTLDASIPEGPGPFPAVIIVHGGGWRNGDKQTFVKPLFEPLTKAGFA